MHRVSAYRDSIRDMKTIKVPRDIVLVDPITGASGDTLAFKNTAIYLWLNDPRANSGPVSTARWSKVIDQFIACTPDSSIYLEDEDYNLLKNIVETPQAKYPPLVARQVIAFDRAVIDATESPKEEPARKK